MIVLAVCDSYAHFKAPIEEYIKRLGKTVEVRLIPSESRKHTEKHKIIQAETESIIKTLERLPRHKLILLIEDGKMLSTEDLDSVVSTVQMSGDKPVFLIGGAYGVDENQLKAYIHTRLSLGKMTLPHSLALLTVLEQIYRVGEIRKGSGYHHGNA